MDGAFYETMNERPRSQFTLISGGFVGGRRHYFSKSAKAPSCFETPCDLLMALPGMSIFNDVWSTRG